MKPLFLKSFENYNFLILLVFSFFILQVGGVTILESIGFVMLVGYGVLRSTTLLEFKKAEIVKFLLILGVSVLLLLTIHSKNVFSFFNKSSIKILLITFLTIYGVESRKKEVLAQYMGLFFLMICVSFALILDYSPIDPYDSSRHAKNVLMIYDDMSSANGFKFIHSLIYYDFYPNLVYLVSVPFVFVFGKSYASICIANSLFWLPFGYYYLVKVCKEYFKLSGLSISVVGLIVFGNIVTIFYATRFLLDFPALCFIPAVLYYFLRSNGLKHRRYAIVSGLLVGLGLLIKSTFLVIAASLIFLVLIRLFFFVLRTKELKLVTTNKLIVNILVFVLFIYMAGGWWYMINFGHFNFTYDKVVTEAGQQEGDPIPLSLDSFLYYIRALADYFSEPLIWILLVVTIIVSVYNFRRRLLLNLVFMIPFIIMYIASTLTWNKDYRTFLPAIFLLLPLFAVGIDYLRKMYGDIVNVVFLLIMLCCSFNYLTNNSLPFFKSGNKELFPFRSPASLDQVEAFFVFNKLYESTFGDDTQIKLNNKPSLVTDFNVSYYKSLLADVTKKDAVVRGDFIHVLALRDDIYNDYYLIGIKYNRLDSLVSLNILNKKARVEGDFKMTVERTMVHSQKKDLEVISFRPDGESPKFKINNADSISCNFKIVHAFPSGQIMDLYYNTLLNSNIETFSRDLIIHNEEAKNNWLQLNIK